LAGYLNLCTTCKADFGSVLAFDTHRVGKHAYTYLEGVQMNPPREDGRRCLDSDEMLERRMELDKRERPGPRGLQPDYVSFERHLEIYEAVSGDRERFVGFDRRYELWAKEHPRDTFGST
jgi:hypothetical protein